MTVTVVFASCSGDDDRTKHDHAWDGPLVAASDGGAGQNNAEPGQLIALVGHVKLINRSVEQVKVTGISEWQPDGMHLAEANLAFGDFIGGGGGLDQDGSAYDFALRGNKDSAISWIKPLLGATIDPNHPGDVYSLVLGFRIIDGYRAGTIRGIVLTYRTASGTAYRVRVPVLTSYCTVGKVDVPECKPIYDRATELFTEDKPLRTPTERERNETGTWPDDG